MAINKNKINLTKLKRMVQTINLKGYYRLLAIDSLVIFIIMIYNLLHKLIKN